MFTLIEEDLGKDGVRVAVHFNGEYLFRCEKDQLKQLYAAIFYKYFNVGE